MLVYETVSGWYSYLHDGISLLAYRYLSAIDAERLSVQECVGYLVPCCLDDPSKCLPGYTHGSRRGFLVQAFKVRKPQGFRLIEAYYHFFQIPSRNPGWFHYSCRYRRA